MNPPASPRVTESVGAVDRVRLRRALISVSDKRDLESFARGLAEFDVELVSTGGTAKALRDAGLAVVDVEALTGFPEMMDGRLKTLHPRVHGGLLGRRDHAGHVQAMSDHGILPIDLVCVDLYPFESAAADPTATTDAIIEQIDIGGPAMIRSAAKNHAFVATVTSPLHYAPLLEHLRAHDGQTTSALRRALAVAAFERTSAYDGAIASWARRRVITADDPARQGVLRSTVLRYGENPHQAGSAIPIAARDPVSVLSSRPLGGKALSYNNLLDGAAALELVQDLVACRSSSLPDLASAVVVKHTNPCGAALAPTAARAVRDALAGDPLAAYGGIVALSEPVDDGVASVLVESGAFLEVVVAPSFTASAVELLSGRWKNVRLLPVGTITPPRAEAQVRSVPGGVLEQERDVLGSDPRTWTRAAGPDRSDAVVHAAVLAELIAKHLKSNAVCIVAPTDHGAMLLGAGAGQMDRVASCRIAIEKAGDRLRAIGARSADDPLVAVAASDAFFPFADGPALLITAGVKAIVHPGGSRRDDETLELCRTHDVTCWITGVRHFRH